MDERAALRCHYPDGCTAIDRSTTGKWGKEGSDFGHEECTGTGDVGDIVAESVFITAAAVAVVAIIAHDEVGVGAQWAREGGHSCRPLECEDLPFDRFEVQVGERRTVGSSSDHNGVIVTKLLQVGDAPVAADHALGVAGSKETVKVVVTIDGEGFGNEESGGVGDAANSFLTGAAAEPLQVGVVVGGALKCLFLLIVDGDPKEATCG